MLPSLSFPISPAWNVPDEAQCVRLWDKYGMMPHIREHCRAVASVALDIVRRAGARGILPEGRGLDEPATLYAANDTLSQQCGDYRITAYDENGEASPYAVGKFCVDANSADPIMQLPNEATRRLLVIEWTVDGKTHRNHFVQGAAPVSFDTWVRWKTILFEQVFDADRGE